MKPKIDYASVCMIMFIVIVMVAVVVENIK